MKRAIIMLSYIMVAFGIGVSGCKDDDEPNPKPDCYVCSYEGDSYTYCFSNYAEDYTRAEFEAYIQELIAEGYSCVPSN